MKRYLKIFLVFIKFNLQRSIVYPKDFLMWLTVDIFWSLINVAFFKVIYLNIPTISGWSFNEMVVVLGIIQILTGLVWSVMYPNMKQLTQDANSGKLDLVLSKPIDSQLMLSLRSFNLNILTSIVIGSSLIDHGLKINNSLNFSSLVLIIFSLLCMTFIAYGSYFIYSTISLFYDRLNNIADVFPHSIDFSRYPTEIFPIIVRFTMSMSFPVIFVTYTPVKILFKGESYTSLFIMAVVSMTIFFLSSKFWNFALKHYSSASS